jgi:hypothetical protein
VDERSQDDVGVDVGELGSAGGPEPAPQARVVRLGGDVLERRRQVGEERLDRGVEALHVPDLHDEPGTVASGDDPFALARGQAQRLLDQHVRARLERVDHDRCVRRVGRADDHRMDGRVGEQRAMVRVHAGHPVPRGDARARHRVGVRERDDAEPVVEPLQQRQVHRLCHQARADDADRHARHTLLGDLSLHGERFDHRLSGSFKRPESASPSEEPRFAR